MSQRLDPAAFANALPLGTAEDWSNLLRLARMVEIDAAGTLTLRNGASRISLRADGRAVVEGENVVVRANGKVAVLAGTIDLN